MTLLLSRNECFHMAGFSYVPFTIAKFRFTRSQKASSDYLFTSLIEKDTGMEYIETVLRSKDGSFVSSRYKFIRPKMSCAQKEKKKLKVAHKI